MTKYVFLALIIDLRRVFDKFSHELRFVDSDFLLSTPIVDDTNSDRFNPSSNSRRRISLQLMDLLQEIGVRHISVHDLVYLHILPHLK